MGKGARGIFEWGRLVLLASSWCESAAFSFPFIVVLLLAGFGCGVVRGRVHGGILGSVYEILIDGRDFDGFLVFK